MLTHETIKKEVKKGLYLSLKLWYNIDTRGSMLAFVLWKYKVIRIHDTLNHLLSVIYTNFIDTII